MRRFLVLITMAAALYAQRQMTVAEAVGFVKSSVKQRLDDRSIADVLKKTKLTEKLDARTVDDIQTMGAGPKTMTALRDLVAESASLPIPAPPAPKPPRTVLPAPDSIEQKRILGEVTENALNYTKSLPNFICLQVTQRHVDPTGTGDGFRLTDKIREQLTYFEHRESYKVMAVNDKSVTNQDHLKLGGATSSGEFGSMMYEIFAPDTDAEFNWSKWATLDGRRMAVYAYRVPQPRSHYSIEHGESGRRIIAGYHGLIYADNNTHVVMRITLECEEIPADFPIQDVKVELTYDIQKIADQEFVLPLRYEIRSRDGKYLAWNEADFRLYRKFGAEASITFDTPDDKEEPKPPAKKKQ